MRKPVTFNEVPGTWALLRNRLLPRQGKSRRLTDFYFSLPLGRVGMLQWQRFDSIAKQGYKYACEALDAMTDEQLKPSAARP